VLYQVCFLGPPQVDSGLFWINRIVDAIFIVDLICQFFLIPPDVETFGVSTETLTTVIRRNYLTGWFTLDVLALLPYDFLVVLIESATDSGNLEMLRLLRVIRFLRLGKVLRVLRASRIIRRYDDRHGISFVKFRITKFIFLSLLSVHWGACLLRIIVLIEDKATDNWIYYYYGTMDVPPADVYNLAIYFVVMTGTSVGYGDVLPRTNTEILATTFIMVAGACVLIFLLGSVASMLNTMDNQQKEYYKLRDTLNDFTATNNLPPALCYKLRHYFRSQFESGALTDWSPVLGKLSNQLKEEISTHLQEKWISNCKYFEGASTEALAAVSNVIVQRSFVAGEMLIQPGEKADTLFIVKQGLVLSDGVLCRPGKMIGTDMLYFSVHKAVILFDEQEATLKPKLGKKSVNLDDTPYSRVMASLDEDDNKPILGSHHVRDYSATAAGYCLTNEMHTDTLTEVLKNFPILLKLVRREAVRVTFQKHIRAYTKAHQKVFGRSDGKVVTTDSSALVCWYEGKLRLIQQNNQPEILQAIIKIQRTVRYCIQRNRFRTVMQALKQDPQMMHRRLTSKLQRIEECLLISGSGKNKGHESDSCSRSCGDTRLNGTATGTDSDLLQKILSQVTESNRNLDELGKTVNACTQTVEELANRLHNLEVAQTGLMSSGSLSI